MVCSFSISWLLAYCIRCLWECDRNKRSSWKAENNWGNQVDRGITRCGAQTKCKFLSKSDEKVLQEVSALQKVRSTTRSKWRDPTRCEQVNEWTNLILRCTFVSRRLCRESALRAKQDKQNVKVRSQGAVGALWQRTEAEARSTVQIVKDGGGASRRSSLKP